MSEQFNAPSELVAISRLNGDFRKNYGKLVGAFLYLWSINAARGRSLLWNAFAIATAFFVYWLRTRG